jgi:hypothetical protein
VYRGDAHDGRLWRRGKASSSGEEPLATFRAAVPQELKSHGQVGGLVECTPDLARLISTVKGHEAIAASNELPFLVALREQGGCATHLPD